MAKNSLVKDPRADMDKVTSREKVNCFNGKYVYVEGVWIRGNVDQRLGVGEWHGRVMVVRQISTTEAGSSKNTIGNMGSQECDTTEYAEQSGEKWLESQGSYTEFDD